MNSNIVDARGRSCPEPVMMTKMALDTGKLPISVLVDNEVAKENVNRFAQSRGFKVTISEQDMEYKLDIKKG